jgi:hypothetical protein
MSAQIYRLITFTKLPLFGTQTNLHPSCKTALHATEVCVPICSMSAVANRSFVAYSHGLRTKNGECGENFTEQKGSDTIFVLFAASNCDVLKGPQKQEADTNIHQ